MAATGQSKVLGNKRKYADEVLGKESSRYSNKDNFTSKQKSKYIEEDHENIAELLRKLPNDITVQLICTKLPWRAFHVLSSVSRAWRRTIQSGEISETRVRSGTAETLAFLQCTFPGKRKRRKCELALYSLRDKAIYQLPSKCSEVCDFPTSSHCITIGGKVYTLREYSGELCVLDVARQKKWQQCASLHTERWDFECAAFDGKIYVFGGYTFDRGPYLSYQPIDFSEVYDPKVDAWTKISPMKFWKSDRTAWPGAVGDEVLVEGGAVYDLNYYDYISGYERHWRRIERSKNGMEAYNPTKDSWRTIPPGDFGQHEVVGREKREILFTAHGRLYSLSRRKISVIDFEKKSIKVLHKCSFKTRTRNKYPRGPFKPDQVLVTNDGLLTIGHFDRCPTPDNKCRLYQSGTIELGIDKKKILLEEVEFSLPFSVTFFDDSCPQPIQL